MMTEHSKQVRAFANTLGAMLTLGVYACSSSPSGPGDELVNRDRSKLNGSQTLRVSLSTPRGRAGYFFCPSGDSPPVLNADIEARATGYDDDFNPVCEVRTNFAESTSCDGATSYSVNVGINEPDGTFNFQCTGWGDWDGNQAERIVSLSA